jgi:hypothetical protein
MPPNDFRLPDDFPDLSLGEKAEKPAAPARPEARPAATPWKVGDRVLAPWEPQFLYVGRVTQVQDGQALIGFEDGDVGWVALDHIRPLAVVRGQKVLSRRRMGPHFFPGEIREVRGDEVCVAFADGGADEWTRIAALRIPCQPLGPGATPAKVASHLAFCENLRAGDRVWAPWQSAMLFAGTVDRVEGKEVHIHFDDGDQGWVLREQLVPLEILVGLPVLARWKMGGQFFPGRVTEVRGERIHIQYDDGDREWTTAAALALPCASYGPDARPTRAARHGNRFAGWLVPLLIGLALLLLRAGCRAGL